MVSFAPRIYIYTRCHQPSRQLINDHATNVVAVSLRVPTARKITVTMVCVVESLGKSTPIIWSMNRHHLILYPLTLHNRFRPTVFLPCLPTVVLRIDLRRRQLPLLHELISIPRRRFCNRTHSLPTLYEYQLVAKYKKIPSAGPIVTNGASDRAIGDIDLCIIAHSLSPQCSGKRDRVPLPLRSVHSITI